MYWKVPCPVFWKIVFGGGPDVPQSLFMFLLMIYDLLIHPFKNELQEWCEIDAK